MKSLIKKSNCFAVLFTGLITIVFFSNCAKKIAFNISPVEPAAQASIKVKKDKNKNYVIDLNVVHLADPSRLSPARENYTVWIDTENNGKKNIGQLVVSAGSLKGSLNAMTPFKPTKVFITAENSAGIEYPGTFVVLTTDSF
jgi:hypothetical protein